MGDTTGISWASSSWNPWHGCIKVSPGCKNCYMYRDKERFGQDPHLVTRSKTTFSAPVKWFQPREVFTCSWSDFFIEQADAWRDDAWDIIQRTPWHRYLILTKRPERINGHLPSLGWPWPWQHVSLGISAENQEYYNQRIVPFMGASAAYRFLSLEPLLGSINLNLDTWGTRISLVIVGGESGHHSRPLQMPWVEYIVDQCQAAHIPIHTKQDSGIRPGMQGRIPDRLWLQEKPRWADVNR